MKLWYSSRPASTRIARLLCYEMGVEVEEHAVDLKNEEHRQTLLELGINSLPALQVPGVLGYFSSLPDMAEYICTLVSAERRLVPWEPEGGFEVRRWTYNVGNLVGVPVGLLELHDDDHYHALLRGALPALEKRLSDMDYLAHDRYSLADCALGVFLASYQAKAHWEPVYPHLADYLRRLKLRPAFQRL